MTIDPIEEARVSAAIAGWAHALGVTQERPIVVATAKATLALRRGADPREACSVGRAFVQSWLHHPSNIGHRSHHAA